MITDIFIEMAFGIFKFFVGLFPPVPQLPAVISNGAYAFMDQVNAVNGVLIYLVGQPLYVAAITLMLFVMLYDLAIKVLIVLVFKTLLKKVVG